MFKLKSSLGPLRQIFDEDTAQALQKAAVVAEIVALGKAEKAKQALND